MKLVKIVGNPKKIFVNLRQTQTTTILTSAVVVALSALILLSTNAAYAAGLTLVTTVGPLTSGPYAFDVAVDNIHNKVYVSNLGCSTCILNGTAQVTVINGSSNAVLSNIPTFAGPRAMAFSPANHRMYVADGLSGQYDVINTDNDTSIGHYLDTGGTDLLSIAVDTTSQKIYAGHFNGDISVLDGSSALPVGSGGLGHTEITHFDTGTGPITELVYSAPTNMIYAIEGLSSDIGPSHGTHVFVINATSTIVDTITLPATPGYGAVDPDTGKVYITYGSNSILEIDGTTHSSHVITGSYDCYADNDLPLAPSVVFNPGNGHLYTAIDSNVCEVSPSTYTQISSVVTTGQTTKQGMAINPSSEKIFVANKVEKTLSVLSTVADTTPPVISNTPSDITQERDQGSNNATVFYLSPNATDVGSGFFEPSGSVLTTNVNCDPASGSQFPIGVTSVDCAISDLAGNPATPTSFLVTVTNPTPTLSLAAPGNVISEKVGGLTGELISAQEGGLSGKTIYFNSTDGLAVPASAVTGGPIIQDNALAGLSSNGTRLILHEHSTIQVPTFAAAPDGVSSLSVRIESSGTNVTARITNGDEGVHDRIITIGTVPKDATIFAYIEGVDPVSERGAELVSVEFAAIGTADHKLSISRLGLNNEQVALQGGIISSSLLAGYSVTPGQHSLEVSPGLYYATFVAPNVTTAATYHVSAAFAGDSLFNAATSPERAIGIITAEGGALPGDTISISPDVLNIYTPVDLPCADDDGDGLCNTWETSGLVYNTATYVLPATLTDQCTPSGSTLGASPNHKDVYLEIDYMQGHLPNCSALNDVIRSFSLADVQNPDNTQGINLHIKVSEQVAFVHNLKVWTDAGGVTDGIDTNDFDHIKNRFFASSSDRGNADLINAMSQVWHYALFAHTISPDSGGSEGCGSASGYAENKGNDIVVALGCGWGGELRTTLLNQNAGTSADNNLYFGSNVGVAEHVNTGSALIGMKVNSLTLAIKRVGATSPAGTISACVLDSTNTCTYTFGTLTINTTNLPSANTYYSKTFTNTASAYTIALGDRIGIKYATVSGQSSATVYISVAGSSQNPSAYDTTKSAKSLYTTAWLADVANDDLGSSAASQAFKLELGNVQVTVGGTAYTDNSLGTQSEQAGTLTHELGHNLNLLHAGPAEILTKAGGTATPATPITTGNPKAISITPPINIYKRQVSLSGYTLTVNGPTLASDGTLLPGTLTMYQTVNFGGTSVTVTTSGSNGPAVVRTLGDTTGLFGTPTVTVSPSTGTILTLTYTLPFSTAANRGVTAADIGTLTTTFYIGANTVLSSAPVGSAPTVSSIIPPDLDQNCKPNYASVMSYSRQLPAYLTGGHWLLDFSRGAFGPLKESALVEADGLKSNITPNPYPYIVYGIPTATAPAAKFGEGQTYTGATKIPIDWVPLPTGTVSGDINNFGITDCNTANIRTTSYYDYWDWGNLGYGFRENRASAYDGMHSLDGTEVELPPASYAAEKAESVTVIITQITPSSQIVQWGTSATFSGTTTRAPAGATVKVFSDSILIAETPVSPVTGNWGPISRLYTAGELGSHTISASLFDGSHNLVGTSPTSTITVVKDNSALNISLTPSGDKFTISGFLKNTDAPGQGVGGKSITFDGTGAAGLPTATTGLDGSFSVVGNRPSSIGTGWTVQAHFAGNTGLRPSDSNVQTYNTQVKLGFSSVWGTTGTGNGQFRGPTGTAADGAGNVYVADTLNNRIEKFTSTGVYVTSWGATGTGNGQFRGPTGITTDAANNVYVIDTGNNRIEKFSSAGAYLSQFGSSQLSISGAKVGIAYGNSGGGFIIVTDTGHNKVAKFSTGGAFITSWGATGTGNGQFRGPTGTAVDGAGNVYVADTLNNRIEKFSSAGAYLSQFGTGGTGNGQFISPTGITTDAANNVYVIDTGNNRIEKFSSAGAYLSQFGTGGTGNGQFSIPTGIATFGTMLYVADTGNNRIEVISLISVTV